MNRRETIKVVAATVAGGLIASANVAECSQSVSCVTLFKSREERDAAMTDQCREFEVMLFGAMFYGFASVEQIAFKPPVDLFWNAA